MARRSEHLLAQTTRGRELFSEAAAREQFSALILPYTARQLAKFSGVTPEGARHWVDGSRCPNLASAVNIARALPSVQDWMMESIGVRETQSGSVDAVIRALYAIAAGEGEEAHKARQMIWRMHHS